MWNFSSFLLSRHRFKIMFYSYGNYLRTNSEIMVYANSQERTSRYFSYVNDVPRHSPLFTKLKFYESHLTNYIYVWMLYLLVFLSRIGRRTSLLQQSIFYFWGEGNSIFIDGIMDKKNHCYSGKIPVQQMKWDNRVKINEVEELFRFVVTHPHIYN